MIETYSYSADGKRRQKVTAGGTTNSVWDGENVLLETDASLVPQGQYTHFPGEWGGLMSQRRGGVSSFHAFDLASNTRALVSVAGAITDSYRYKAFGEELAVTGTTTNPHRYGGAVGYQRDSATRQYVRARHLGVSTGRWISQDPLGLGGGDGNLYRYVGNQPVTRVDPSGEQFTPLVPDPVPFFFGSVRPEVCDIARNLRCRALMEPAILDVCKALNTQLGRRIAWTCIFKTWTRYYSGPDRNRTREAGRVLNCLRRWCQKPLSQQFFVYPSSSPECFDTRIFGLRFTDCGATLPARGPQGTIGICLSTCEGDSGCNKPAFRRNTVIHEALHLCQPSGAKEFSDAVHDAIYDAATCITDSLKVKGLLPQPGPDLPPARPGNAII